MATATATATANVLDKYLPFQDRILVKRSEAAERTAGGLYIPDTAKEKSQEGEVVSVGKGKTNDEGKVIPLEVKVGDRILFGKYAGTNVPIEIDGAEYLLVREEEVLVIIKK
jgi:chaperonin GroES